MDCYLESVRNGSSLSVGKNGLVVDSWKTGFARFLSDKQDSVRVSQVAHLILDHLENTEDKSQWIELGDLLIKKGKKNKSTTKVLTLFDRRLFQHRIEKKYIHKNNIKDFERWTGYGFDQKIFDCFPDFAKFMLTTPLASQIKRAGTSPEMVFDRPSILVEGKQTDYAEVLERFTCEWSSNCGEFFLVDKFSRDVYTYLANGKGLQKHHPYFDLDPVAMAHLDEKDYQKTVAVARQFVRPEEAELSLDARNKANEDRDFVLQIVSSNVGGQNSKAGKLLLASKHPWIRIVCGKDVPEENIKKGDVFEVGFNWNYKPFLPSMAIHGRFRSVDLWNYKKTKEKVVTNIAVTEDEAMDLAAYAIRYHRDSRNLGKNVGFDLRTQNCSTFVHFAVGKVGIHLPTKISLTDLLIKITPDQVVTVLKKVKASFSIFSPPSCVRESRLAELVHKISVLGARLLEALVSIPAKVILFLTGAALGEEGRAFTEDDGVEEVVRPHLWKMHNWFKLTDGYYLPGLIQEWQREQPSTVIYENASTFCIVPESIS